MKCNKCGNDLPQGTTLCPFCGNQTINPNLNYNNVNNQMSQVNNVVNNNDNFNTNNQFQNNINNNMVNNQQNLQMMNNQFEPNTMNSTYNNPNPLNNNYSQGINPNIQMPQNNNTNNKSNNLFIIIVIILVVVIIGLVILVLNKNGVLSNNNDNNTVDNNNSSNSNTINDSNTTKLNISDYQVTIPSGLYYIYDEEDDTYTFYNNDFKYSYRIIDDSVDYYINNPSCLYSEFTQSGLSSINEEIKTIDGVKAIIYTLKDTQAPSDDDKIYYS